MKQLKIVGDNKYPTIILSPEENHFEVSGKSIPADAESFYRPILDWVEEYTKNPLPKTRFTFDLEYFNIASSKRILFLLFKLNEIISRGHEVDIEWHYQNDDPDMFEVGQDLAFMVKTPFRFIAKQALVEESAA